MKINIPKGWLTKAAKLEGDIPFGAGVPMDFSDAIVEESNAPTDTSRDMRVAFGRLVGFKRQQRHWSPEKLATTAGIEVHEIISIESCAFDDLEMSTVYQLAKALVLPEARLLQLAGFVEPRDEAFVQEAIRFAAHSQPISKFTSSERAMLEQFIAVLSLTPTSSKDEKRPHKGARAEAYRHAH